MKHTIIFRKLRNGSTFEFKGVKMRKVSNAFSIDSEGKDHILALHDRVTILPEKLHIRFC